MRAVERALVRHMTAPKEVNWHSQGSGKTYTMITIAKRLVEEPVFQNPTVLILVDRTELETQLFANLAAVGLGSVEVATSKERLKELLRNDTRGIIVSMIHKFDDIPARINTRSNIFVLVDEAHRTTGDDLGNYLMGALPNDTYLGFTGTPVDKTAYGKGTFKVFGIDDPQGYLDKYSIAESVEDGTTVPLYYSLAPNELRVNRDVLEKEFLQLAEAEGVSDIEELNRVLDKAVNLKNMLKNRERVQQVAKYIAQHFRDTVEPLEYKAFIVGVDREACCLYKEALAFDSRDVQSVIEGVEILKTRFRERMDRGRTDYLPLVQGKTPDKAAEAALEIFRDEVKRQEYYGYFRELEDLYEILSPAPFLREFIDDYQMLADLYALLRSAYDNRGVIHRELARKTAYLVQHHTTAGEIHEAVSVFEVTPKTLEKIAKKSQPDTVKVFNPLKSINQKVADEAVKAPYLFTIGERAEAIIEAFKQRQVSTREALRQLEKLIREINEAEREQAERGIVGEAFATLWILKQGNASLEVAENVARQVMETLKEYPHWRTSDEQSRQVRRRLYALLEQSGIKDIPKTVEQIMSVIKRR